MENNNKELQIYKCTEDFMMQIFNEKGIPTGEYLPIHKGTKWISDSKEVNLSNGELSLSSENLKIRITKERLKRSFKKIAMIYVDRKGLDLQKLPKGYKVIKRVDTGCQSF